MTVADRAAAFLDDILAEPATLARLLEAYEAPNGPLSALPHDLPERAARVVLVGLGSSGYAALDAAASLRAAGLAAWAEFAGADPATPPARDLVVIAISASGRTPEVVEVIERHRGTSLVIGVTEHPGEPVGTRADLVLPLLAGVEASGIACRSFQATTVVLALVAARLTGGAPPARRLRAAVAALDALVAARGTWLEQAIEQLDHAPAIGVLAPAARLGRAEQAALMLREAPRLPAAAHETGDWLHTAVYTALPGYRAILLGRSPRDAQAIATIARRGGRTLGLGSASGADVAIPVDGPAAVDDDPSALVASTVAELLAAGLWERVDGQVKRT